MTETKTVLPTLLAVDDDDQILKQIQWALSDNYQVFSASDRETALRIFKTERMRVVLLDLGLPPAWFRRRVARRGQLLIRRGQRRAAPGRRLGGCFGRADEPGRRRPAAVPARPEAPPLGVRRLAPRPLAVLRHFSPRASILVLLVRRTYGQAQK